MGWTRTLLLGDIGNRLDIEDTERDIDEIRRELRSARRINQSQSEALQQLQQEAEELELCVAALFKALQRKGILSDDELKNLVDMIER